MKVCGICGTTSEDAKIIKNKTKGHLCAKCYQRDRLNPIIHELPSHGEITYDDEGKPICHICGKAYKKLLSHVWQLHHSSAYEYKKEFGLETTKGIMSEESTELARERLLENYEVSVQENLIKRGQNTRFKHGGKGRTKDMVSQQSKLNWSSRFKKED